MFVGVQHSGDVILPFPLELLNKNDYYAGWFNSSAAAAAAINAAVAGEEIENEEKKRMKSK